MGKKKTYEVSEQHKRVDIFRTIQVPNSKPSPYIKEYTNDSFVGSANNLDNTNIQFSRPQPQPPLNNQNRNINVWSTSNSASNLNKINNLNTLNNTNKSLFINKKKSNRKIILTVSVTLVIFLFVATTIGLAVYYSIFFKDLKCPRECISSNEYCLTNQNKTSSSCQCKQGYTNKSNKCEQTACFNNYYPFTYLNTDTAHDNAQTPVAYESKFLKPLCCPNSNHLTSSCCGVSLANTSLMQVSKRIIGGNTLTQGIFPWIVYVTQVYRVNQQIQMIKNCSGTLLNEWHVLTAGHCIEVDRDIVSFNSEFSSVESIMRVYFGFTDKSVAFQSNVMATYERRVKNVIIHPKYDQMYLLNDLAILRLDKPIYRSINSDYLCLFDYDRQDALVSSLKLYTAGWGSISPDHLNLNYPDRINYVDAIVFPMSFCKYIYPEPEYNFLFNSTTHVCAGYQQSAGKDTCYADSGSPLMVQLKEQWFIYGVVSFGSQPDCAKGPSMFVRIANYADWIKSVIN